MREDFPINLNNGRSDNFINSKKKYKVGLPHDNLKFTAKILFFIINNL